MTYNQGPEGWIGMDPYQLLIDRRLQQTAEKDNVMQNFYGLSACPLERFLLLQ